MLRTWIVTAKDRFAAYRRYRKAIAEIETLTQSDLIDIGAFEVDLRHAARREILG
jgi:uncharacterized protein YjiS (DUF1127 family)